MLFNSIEFLIFLPIVFLLYWYVFQRSLKAQNLFIVVVSYIFYGWWDWRFLILIAFTSFISWGSGVLIERNREKHKTPYLQQKGCKIITLTNIIINILILIIFKYYNFFVNSFIEAFSLIGITLHSPSLQLILPVGISFYTFQALSYSIDVYRKSITPTKDIVAFFAYVSFFPQLVAGPIERATNLLPQFYKSRTFNYEKAIDGMRQILWGFFKKVVIADNCAYFVNIIFNDYQQANSLMLVLGAIFFSFQIYGDFSGYSDIAIGTAKLFGIELKMNFNVPYFSRNIAEFWRRWHISLNTWFRDYIYIPLGGSRCSKIKQFRNTMIVFTISGLWHGANWTYIIWGIYHGILFLPLMFSGNNRRYLDIASKGKQFPSIKDTIHIISTFILVMLGWIIFRADSISTAMQYIKRMCKLSPALPNIQDFGFSKISILSTIFFIILTIIIEWIQREKDYIIDTRIINHQAIRWGIYFLILFSIIIFTGKQETFIYFQF